MISSANWRAHHGLYRHLGSFMKICSGFNVRRKRKWAARARGEEGDSKGEEARRVCDGCRTSETPLWRKGPNGNQTLCNACGIRERKRIQSSKINKKSSSTGIFSSSSSSSSTLEELSSEELKQRQKEKQMMMLKLMGWNKKRMMAKVRRIDKDEAEAALLLLSLSSPLV